MKKKLSLIFLMLCAVILPKNVKAIDEFELDSEELGPIVASETKYYKTVTTHNTSMLYSLLSNDNEYNSYTEEITEEEYNNADTASSTFSSVSIETTYKKLTSTIQQNGTLYRYKAELNWKNMPSKRSYDIIALGHYTDVRTVTGTIFNQTSCTSSTNCSTTSSYYEKITNSGAGATFKLPTGNFVTLKQLFYYDTAKVNNSNTITSQVCTGDYAHAVSTVTATEGQNYTIGSAGISFPTSDVGNKYDEIQAARAYWYGNW